ncbi:MAG: sialate O-acetylesterase [Candidatus Omnitrophica bacterium]|nr:sialate O-acetylesterase [Candidatus Omnitrophota bacterium]
MLLVWTPGLALMSLSASATLTVTSGLADYQVFQRSATDTVTLRVEGEASTAGIIVATLSSDGKPLEGFEKREIAQTGGGAWKGTLHGVPLGGPYTVSLTLVGAEGNPVGEVAFKGVLVGDLWLMAGQSNMQGYGDMVNVEPPSDRVNVFRMRGQWDVAVEPLHRLHESVDRVHRGEAPMPSLDESDTATARLQKGTGLGLPFAKQMVARTGVPVGLIPCAHGGTSMTQWDPKLRGNGGDSLYGSLLGALKAVGGRIAGVLWYQGEGDSGGDQPAMYTQRFTELIQALREDAGNPNLPFYYVQIGTFAHPNKALVPGWNSIQEQQRKLEETVPNTAVVASVDLPLDDLIHIGTEGLKRLGKRLANVAIGSPSRGPRLDHLERAPGGLRVVFREGSGKLQTPRTRVSGFTIHDASGEDLCLIYKQLVDPQNPNAVWLGLVSDPPEGAQLWYGHGLAPFCNLADTEDMAVLVMGPIPIPKP